jgi:hypothetical protein
MRPDRHQSTIDQDPESPAIRFRRFECKYVIPESLAVEVRRYIRPFVVVDPHAAGSPDRSYDVANLYLDSPDLALYRQSREGLLDRVKLRIRRYGPSDSAPAHLEVKRRHDRLVLKDRARLPVPAAARLVSGFAPDTSELPDDERACYDEFTRLTARWLARPVVWAIYRREAWIGDFDRRLRITMDRALVRAEPSSGIDLPSPASRRPLGAEGVVLELKFDDSFPAWLAGMVRALGLMRQSFSKYVRSVEAV